MFNKNKRAGQQIRLNFFTHKKKRGTKTLNIIKKNNKVKNNTTIAKHHIIIFFAMHKINNFP